MSLRLRRTEQHGDGGLLLLVFYHGAVSATSATYQQHRGRLHGGIRAASSLMLNSHRPTRRNNTLASRCGVN